MTQRLPVGRIPEQLLVALMGNDVVYVCGRGDTTFRIAYDADRVTRQPSHSRLAPSVPIPTLSRCPSLLLWHIMFASSSRCRVRLVSSRALGHQSPHRRAIQVGGRGIVWVSLVGQGLDEQSEQLVRPALLG